MKMYARFHVTLWGISVSCHDRHRLARRRPRPRPTSVHTSTSTSVHTSTSVSASTWSEGEVSRLLATTAAASPYQAAPGALLITRGGWQYAVPDGPHHHPPTWRGRFELVNLSPCDDVMVTSLRGEVFGFSTRQGPPTHAALRRPLRLRLVGEEEEEEEGAEGGGGEGGEGDPGRLPGTHLHRTTPYWITTVLPAGHTRPSCKGECGCRRMFASRGGLALGVDCSEPNLVCPLRWASNVSWISSVSHGFFTV